MKLKKNIMLGSVDGNHFAIATGKLSKKLKGIINNNETADYIFQLLKNEQTVETIVKAMSEKYDATEEEIRADVVEFLEVIKEMDILE